MNMSTVQPDMTCWEHTQTFAASAAHTIKEGAVEAGTWLANGTVHVVTWLKDVWFWIQDNGINCAIWIKDGVVSAGRSVWQAAGRAYEAAFPAIMSVVDAAKKYAVQTYTRRKRVCTRSPQRDYRGHLCICSWYICIVLIYTILLQMRR